MKRKFLNFFVVVCFGFVISGCNSEPEICIKQSEARAQAHEPADFSIDW